MLPRSCGARRSSLSNVSCRRGCLVVQAISCLPPRVVVSRTPQPSRREWPAAMLVDLGRPASVPPRAVGLAASVCCTAAATTVSSCSCVARRLCLAVLVLLFASRTINMLRTWGLRYSILWSRGPGTHPFVAAVEHPQRPQSEWELGAQAFEATGWSAGPHSGPEHTNRMVLAARSCSRSSEPGRRVCRR